MGNEKKMFERPLRVLERGFWGSEEERKAYIGGTWRLRNCIMARSLRCCSAVPGDRPVGAPCFRLPRSLPLHPEPFRFFRLPLPAPASTLPHRSLTASSGFRLFRPAL